MKKIKILKNFFSKDINDPYSILKRNSIDFLKFKLSINKKSIW